MSQSFKILGSIFSVKLCVLFDKLSHCFGQLNIQLHFKNTMEDKGKAFCIKLF